eukprot:9008145-Pyramimonas_sp.AAC.1
MPPRLRGLSTRPFLSCGCLARQADISLQRPPSDARINCTVAPILPSRDSASGALRSGLPKRSATARMQALDLHGLPKTVADGSPRIA